MPDTGPGSPSSSSDSVEREPSLPREDVRQQAIHQPKDKSAKNFYSDWIMMGEFLDKHLPRELLSGLELGEAIAVPTEYIDRKHRTVRHLDLVWRIPFRDSLLFLLVLFEAQSTVDRQMAVRILVRTALVYDQSLKDEKVRELGTLPLVLPIVVYVGTEPWNAPTSLEELLPKEAEPFLPYALGHKFFLVSEAEEAKTLGEVDTPRAAALKLRYAEDREEFQEALATLKKLLPTNSHTRQALVEWVRISMTEQGAKEEQMAELEKLEDLGKPIIETWWVRERRESREEGHAEGHAEGLAEGRTEGLAEGREEGRKQGRREAEAWVSRRQRATLVRLTRRKFGAETGDALAALLEGVSDEECLDAVADLIVDCDGGRDLLARVEDVRAGSG